MTQRLRLPHGHGLTAVTAGGAAWIGAFGGFHLGGRFAVPAALAATLVVARSGGKTMLVAGVVVAASLSGAMAHGRAAATLEAALPQGRVSAVVTIAEDPLPTMDDEFRFVGRVLHHDVGTGWRGPLPPIAVIVDEPVGVVAGDRALVTGFMRSRPHLVRGDPVAGDLTARSVVRIDGAEHVLFRVGNALRWRVSTQLSPHAHRPEGGLLAGFLIGDTTGLGIDDLVALRRSGLTHYVAVSGSNVALFLLAWWFVTAPLSIHPRLRGVVGLAGLALFVVVTRWEPSVLRAAVMAGIVLAARVVSIPVDAWTALGSAAVVLMVVSGQLAADVGFQLSAVATAGVLAGAGMFHGRRPAAAWTALGAAVSAQAAVIPILLIHFGTVPLLSPVANLAAAPLVTAATVLGGVGVISGLTVAVDGGVVVSSWVLAIARSAAGWPQLSAGGVTLAALAGLLAIRPSVRPVLAVAGAAMLAGVHLLPVGGVITPTVTFLDVGQGDAVLVRDQQAVLLVDAGREPAVIRAALAKRGIERIDLLVATHGDADHVGGMVGLAAEVTVRHLWVPDQADLGDTLPGVMVEVERYGGIVTSPRAGTAATIGTWQLEVLGPARRFQSQNDGSIVLWLEAAGSSVLLPGDIEAVAQRELPERNPDIMLVPHHGSLTTDLGWLEETVGGLAVVSVGDNTYGHPAAEVMAVLVGSGAVVRTTLDDGDIDVPLGSTGALNGRRAPQSHVTFDRYARLHEADRRHLRAQGRRPRRAGADAGACSRRLRSTWRCRRRPHRRSRDRGRGRRERG